MKEKDQIKEFLDRNRDEFDDLNPPDIWGEIESEIGPDRFEKMVPLRRVLQIAAGVAVLIAAAWIYTSRNPEGKMVAKIDQNEVPLSFYPELVEAGLYYDVKIQAAGKELEQFSLDKKDLETIQLLEDELEELRLSLGNEPDDRQVVEAMIGIYRHKLALMEDLLIQLKNESRNDEDEDIDVVAL